jgi:type II secretory pathway pseudopilin PulG
MDLVNVIAIVLGLLGAALGSLGWWKAREAKALAAGAYRMAQEAQRAAAEASRAASAAHAAQTRTHLSQEAARALHEPLLTSPRTETMANIVVRSGSTLGQDLPTNQGSGSGLIGIFLINEGPAVAHAMQLHATFPNGTRRSSDLLRTLSAHKEVTLFAQVVPADFGADDPLHVLYQIAYQDGNGEQAFERDIRVEGGWKGPWKTYIEPKQIIETK